MQCESKRSKYSKCSKQSGSTEKTGGVRYEVCHCNCNCPVKFRSVCAAKGTLPVALCLSSPCTSPAHLRLPWRFLPRPRWSTLSAAQPVTRGPVESRLSAQIPTRTNSLTGQREDLSRGGGGRLAGWSPLVGANAVLLSMSVHSRLHRTSFGVLTSAIIPLLHHLDTLSIHTHHTRSSNSPNSPPSRPPSGVPRLHVRNLCT